MPLYVYESVNWCRGPIVDQIFAYFITWGGGDYTLFYCTGGVPGNGWGYGNSEGVADFDIML